MNQMLLEIFNQKVSSFSDILFSSYGDLTFKHLEKILTDLEAKLFSKINDAKFVRKLYTISVEILQNIYHHASFDEENEKCYFFIIAKNDTKFIIVSANLVENKNRTIIKSRIDQINSLNNDDLKRLYLRILDDRKFTEKGGGSLGILDVKRKTKEKLFYTFIRLNQYKFIYIFEVSVKAKKNKKNEVINN